MTIYAAIAASILPVLPQFTVGGPEWTVYETTPGSPSASASTAALDGTVTLYVIDNTGPRFRQAVAGLPIWDSDWLAFGAASLTLEAEDIVSDGARAFLLTGAPITHFGMFIAPVEAIAPPDQNVPLLRVLRVGAAQGLHAGY